ncbi:MAG: phosphonate metabolism protein/1,5-bisphosphokinase (PRPP-forming) PhnN [Promethearchaeota archaeon]
MKKGQLFFLIGNSGSGKDSLLNEVLSSWPKDFVSIKVPQRYITRPSHETEPFISVSKEKFIEMKNKNEFSLTWHIYDLDYGVPKIIEKWLSDGFNVIINVSRTIVPQARKKFPNLRVIFVKVPFEITLKRIKSRGREDENSEKFKMRVKRAKENQEYPEADFVIDNSGDLSFAVQKLKDYLLSFAEKSKKGEN